MSRAPVRKRATADPESARRLFFSGLDELWDAASGAAATGPSRRTTIDRDGIVAVAVAVADAEGIEAVSMRRIATELGSGPMSLYRHVPNKEALVTFMIEQVLGEVPFPDGLPSGDWRADLRRLARESWALMRRHPWYAEATMVRPPLSPHSIGGLEFSLSLLDGLGLTLGEQMLMVMSVHSAVVGAAINLAIEERTRAELSVSDEEIFSTLRSYLARIAERGLYPRVTELFGSLAIDDHDDQAHLEAQVELILDGCAARIAAAQARRGAEPDG